MVGEEIPRDNKHPSDIMPGVMETVSKQAEIIPRDFYLMRIAALPEINKIAKYFIRNKIPVSDGDYSRNLKTTDQCQ